MIKRHLFWPALICLLPLTAYADKNANDQLDEDFLHFLMEVEESTGDGFNDWLATEVIEDENPNNEVSENK